MNLIDSSQTDSKKSSNYKDLIKDMLTLTSCTVTFTKKDGTERVMKCTLNPDVVTPYEKKTDRIRESNDDILPVWDLEANAWRSITVSKIQTIEVTN